MQNIIDRTTPQSPAWTIESVRRIAIEVTGYFLALAVATLLALWIYGAWLDIQPPARPRVWHDKTWGNVCYFTKDFLVCLPQ